MKIDDINRIISSLSQGEIKNVCILDNNSIGFLLKIENDVSINQFFEKYDLILLPRWVEIEVNDGVHRKSYIDKVSELQNTLFYFIDEIEYIDLLKGRDVYLFKIFSEVCKFDAKLFGFIKRNILKSNDVEELPEYEEWLRLLYNYGFSSEKLKCGREKKKNAGEISISVLAYIISKFYNIDNVTIISQDRDTYDIISRAETYLIKEIDFEYAASITFKSNDFIINEFYKLENLNPLEERINNLRNARYIKFVRTMSDSSIEECNRKVDNDEFLMLLKDSTFKIIF